jgi:endonuclease/exonuclease/phosphatase family metal-dependent hydrolase
MKINYALAHCLIPTIMFVFLLSGCTPPEEVKNPEKVEPFPAKEPTPATIFNVATLNLSKSGTKYEKQSISKLSEIIKQEDIQIISLQGVTRYPEISTRIDFIDELRLQADMYQKFGETQNISGRQIGNAVLSAYPIKSSENFEYKKSKTLATALATSVDAGVGNVLFVSTLLPESISSAEKLDCISVLEEIKKMYESAFFIVTGNISLLGKNNFNELNLENGNIKNQNIFPQILYLANDVMKLLDTKKEETRYGVLLIFKFGLFNQPVNKR